MRRWPSCTPCMQQDPLTQFSHGSRSTGPRCFWTSKQLISALLLCGRQKTQCHNRELRCRGRSWYHPSIHVLLSVCSWKVSEHARLALDSASPNTATGQHSGCLSRRRFKRLEVWSHGCTPPTVHRPARGAGQSMTCGWPLPLRHPPRLVSCPAEFDHRERRSDHGWRVEEGCLQRACFFLPFFLLFFLSFFLCSSQHSLLNPRLRGFAQGTA